jgi:hypothetical protein
MTTSRDGEDSSIEIRLALVQKMLDQAASELADVLSQIGKKDNGGENGRQR